MTTSVNHASSVSPAAPQASRRPRWAQAGPRLACQRPSVSVRPWFRPSCEESLSLNQGLRSQRKFWVNARGDAERFKLEAPLDRWREVRNRMHATICKRGFDNSRNTFTQQQFSLARQCQQALLRKLPYALVSTRGLIREHRPHPGHIEEMRP